MIVGGGFDVDAVGPLLKLLPAAAHGSRGRHFRLRFEIVIMIFLPRMIVVHAVGIKLGLELLARLAWLHQVFASTQGLLSLPLCGAVRLSHPFFVTTIRGLLTTCIRITRFCRVLLPSVMHHTLSVFEHFLPPKLEEVRRIGVEFQAVLAVLPVGIEFVQRGRLVTGHVSFLQSFRHGFS